MKYDEVWSYSIDRIREYFTRCGAVSHDPMWVIGEVEIQLFAIEDRTIGPISLPQTRVVITGDNDTDVEKVYHDFYLNFLSGGA